MKKIFIPIDRLISMLMLSLFMLTVAASAHVPLMAEGNEDISSAIHISNPLKSWAIYGDLQGDAVEYYSFEIEKGDKIYLSLFKSADLKENHFEPELLLIGRGLDEEIGILGLSDLADSDSDIRALRAEECASKSATYEPFGPSSFIELSIINITAPETGVYYAAVRSDQRGSQIEENESKPNATAGNYGLAVGYKEESSFSDRISTPIRLISVYIWEGQSLGIVLIPYVVAAIIAMILFYRGSRRTSFCLAGSLAGFLFLATSASVLNQMTFSLTRAPFGPQVYITLAIAFFHALLGVAAIRLANGEAGILQRAILAVVGTIALLAGSGMIIGPFLSLASSFLPSRMGSIFGQRRDGSIKERK